MKLLPLAFAFALVVRVAASDPLDRASLGEDNLVPVDWKIKTEDRYRRLLELKLGITPFDCGRAIMQPSFGGETSVSVYSLLTKNGQRTYCVTYCEAEANFWQRTNGLQHIDAARNVRVRRIDAEIPQQAAGIVKEVWLRMLQDSRPIDPTSRKFVVSGLDVEFSLQRSDDRPVYGDLGLPAQGNKTKALKRLADALVEYCQAAPAKRTAIANKIEREAKQLRTRLQMGK